MEETVKIKRLRGFIKIPLSKYNERIHELYEDPKGEPVTINPRNEVQSAPKLIVHEAQPFQTGGIVDPPVGGYEKILHDGYVIPNHVVSTKPLKKAPKKKKKTKRTKKVKK